MNLRKILTAGLTTLVLACGGDIVKPPPPPPPPPPNRAPIITSTCPTQIEENVLYQCQVKATDPDGDVINYRMIRGPSWLNFASNSIFGRAPEVLEDTNYDIEFQVRDSKGLGTNQSFVLTVQNVSNTHVLAGDDLTKIVSVEEDRIVFSEPQDFEVGDIIVPDFGNSSATSSLTRAPALADWPGCDYNPQGFFLRRIISWGADKLTAQTEPATIEEAVKNDLFLADETLSLPAGQTYSGIEGVSINASQQGLGFNINIDHVVFEDGLERVTLEGNVSFNSRFVLEGSVENLRLRELIFKNVTEGNLDITLKSNVRLSDIPGKEIELFGCTLPTLTIYTPSGFPIYITPKLDVNVGIGPSKITPLEARVTGQMRFEPGLSYDGSRWGILKDFSSDFSASISNIGGGVDINAYVAPRLTLLLYEALGPFAGINVGMQLESSDEKAELYRTLLAPVGIDMGIFSRIIPNFSDTIPHPRKLLWEEIIEVKTDTIQPGPEGKDAYVRYVLYPDGFEDFLGYGDTPLILLRREYFGNHGVEDEGLFEFPLSQIPSNSNVESAKLRIYGYTITNMSGATSTTVELSRLESSWEESTVKWDTKPTRVFLEGIISREGIGSSWHEFDVTSVVQEWINGEPNYGFNISLVGNDVSGKLYSSDNPEQDRRPMLIVNYR